MSSSVVRPLAGLGMLAVVVVLFGVTVAMFTGATSSSATVTVVAPRAGLVMDVDSKVKMHGVTVGRVADIDYTDEGTARLELALDPDQIERIPADVDVQIAAPTVFGAKGVEFVPRKGASTEVAATGRLHDGQELTAGDVEIEVNTVFGELTKVLGEIKPAELNAALSALSTALSGRGEQLGTTLTDLNDFLGTVEPGMPALRVLLRDAPGVLEVYADTSGRLLDTVGNVSSLSDTLVDQQDNLDAFLTSVIGLSTTGDTVLKNNRAPLAKALDVLAPTLSLTDEYNEALTCSLNGFADLADSPPADVPGLGLSANFLWGQEPYKNPSDLPIIGATGGPQCSMLPVGFQEKPPFVVANTGANPYASSRKTVKLNVKSLRQMLFGPIPDGATR